MSRATSKSAKPTQTGSLAKLAQNGEPEAMDALVRRIQDRLLRFCYYLTGNEQRAQDLCQEALVKVLENLPSLKDPKKFVGWLFQLTRNHFLNYVRNASNKDYRELSDVTSSRLAQAPGNELAAQIEQKLATLTPEERFVVLLFCMEGRSYDEVAKISGLSKEAVRSKLYRVRKAFKEEFFTGKLKL